MLADERKFSFRYVMNATPPLPPRRRRLVALPQANIARAVRAAQSDGSTWYVETEGDVIRLFQGAPLVGKAEPEQDAPEKTWRL
jgi:hypothetical protein